MTPGQSWALLALVALFAILLTRAIVLIERKAERAIKVALLALGRNDVVDPYDLWSDQRFIDEAEQEEWRAARIGQAIEHRPDLWEVPVSRNFSVQGRTRVEALEAAEPYREAS